jgi:hypothetical protein
MFIVAVPLAHGVILGLEQNHNFSTLEQRTLTHTDCLKHPTRLTCQLQSLGDTVGVTIEKFAGYLGIVKLVFYPRAEATRMPEFRARDSWRFLKFDFTK